jgi:thiol-disulfide isomerase/thioredoxin
VKNIFERRLEMKLKMGLKMNWDSEVEIEAGRRLGITPGMKRHASYVGLVFVLVLMFAGIVAFGSQTAHASVIKTQAGPSQVTRDQPAPAFDLNGLDGKAYHVGGAREKPLIINFWASWCGPCHDEAPEFKRMYERHKNELDVYSVNATQKDQLEAVRGFVKQYKLSFPVLLDHQGTVSGKYRLLFVPTSFLVNRQGIVVDVIHVLTPEELEKKVRLLIGG